MPTTLTALDFSIILIYMAMVLVIGSVLGFFVRNIKEYFAGGSSIPWYLGAISNYMTMMSTYVFVASAGIAYDEGIAAIVILWSAALPTLFTTFCLAKLWKRSGIITPVEYLETRFNISVRQISSWGGVVFRIIDNMIRLYAIGIFVSVACGMSLVTAIVFCGLVVVIYTMIGGLYAVIITDTVQCVILVLSCLVLLPLTLGAVGGLGALYEATPQSFGLGNGPKGQVWFLAVYYLMILIKYNGNWAFIQRFYSMESESEARKMGLGAVAMYLVLPILFLLPAIAGRVLFPELQNPETVYVNVCKLLLPSGMMGLMIAAMFAATMSTLSAEYNVTAGVLTRDVYQRLFHPAASERESMFVARSATLLLGILIMVGSLYIGKIGGAFEANKLFTGMLGVPIVVPLVFGILWKRPKPIGAITAMLGGFLIGFLFYMTEKFDWETGTSAQTLLNGIAAMKWETKTFIQICCCLLFYFASAFLPDRNAEYAQRVNAFFEKLKVPCRSDEKGSGTNRLKYAMFLLLAVSQLLCGGLFVFVSLFHWGTTSSHWAFGCGAVCMLTGVIPCVVMRKEFFALRAVPATAAATGRSSLPLRIVQFGEGNFLRAFIDWMIQQLNDQRLFSGSVRIIEPLPHGTGDILNEQDGFYTVLLRGLENGNVVEKFQRISCIEGSYNAYRDWDAVLALARVETLQFVFSNTTEAGIEYKSEPYRKGTTPETFPAKLTAFLFERFQCGGSGLWIIPCELIEHNASCLKQYVLRYAVDWNLGSDFANWIERENRFVNTLVDRIVAGYPKAEAEAICNQLGYEDRLLVAGEPFHFFALEAPESLERILPLRQAGLNVVLTDDITPYRTRKVLLLNGGHTSSALAAFLSGLNFVDEMVADPLFNRFLRGLLYEEVLPTIDLPEQEKTEFLEAVLERFANPFAKHRLHSITLNSVSKWKVRVLPSLLKLHEKSGTLPERLAFSLAALIVFYENAQGKGKREDGSEYEIPDDSEIVRFFETAWRKHRIEPLVQTVLSSNEFWGRDLNEIEGLTGTITLFVEKIKTDGTRRALENVLEGLP